MTTPEPMPTAAAKAMSRPPSERPARRPLRRLQQDDRGSDVERRDQPERQAVAEQRRRRRRGISADDDAEPAHRCRGRPRTAARRRRRAPRRQLRTASSDAEQDHHHAEQPGQQAGHGVGVDVLRLEPVHAASSRPARRRRTPASRGRRAGRSPPAPAAWPARAGRPRRGRRSSTPSPVRGRGRSGLGDADRVGRDLGLAAVEAAARRWPAIGREHRLLRRLAGHRREQRAAAVGVLLDRLALGDVARPRSSPASSPPRRARPWA